MGLYDEYEDEDTRRQNRPAEVYPSNPSSAVSDGYGNPTDGLGSPKSGYGAGGVNNPAYQNYNGGTPPPPPAPRYDYNGGAPPDQALAAGHGWEWEGPKEQTWNDELGQWNRGVWQQRAGSGLGYTAPGSPPPPAPPRGPAFQPAAGTPSSYRAPEAGGAPAAQASYKTNPVTDEVTRILMARLKDLQNPGDINSDPIYQNAVKAYQVGALRAADKERKALAERTAASGTRASGGFNVGVQGINERAGEKATQFRSGLALDRMSAREQQLNQAIQMARAVGQDDIANQLELQRLQLQGELGRGDLALRGELGRGQLGLGYDQLGFSYTDLITRANRDATLAALQGGG